MLKWTKVWDLIVWGRSIQIRWDQKTQTLNWRLMVASNSFIDIIIARKNKQYLGFSSSWQYLGHILVRYPRSPFHTLLQDEKDIKFINTALCCYNFFVCIFCMLKENLSKVTIVCFQDFFKCNSRMLSKQFAIKNFGCGGRLLLEMVLQ